MSKINHRALLNLICVKIYIYRKSVLQSPRQSPVQMNAEVFWRVARLVSYFKFLYFPIFVVSKFKRNLTGSKCNWHESLEMNSDSPEAIFEVTLSQPLALLRETAWSFSLTSVQGACKTLAGVQCSCRFPILQHRILPVRETIGAAR